MVNPNDITNFNRTQEELEEFLLFAVSVAGKTAEVQAPKLDKFLMGRLESPFYFIRKLDRRGVLEDRLRRVKLGKYSILVPCFRSLANDDPDLKEITREELEEYHGIGEKTSKFFLLHSRTDCNIASLDTHILKWLDEETSDDIQVPEKTPSSEDEYQKFQKIFLEKAEDYEESVAKLDLKVWNYYSGNEDKLVLNSK